MKGFFLSSRTRHHLHKPKTLHNVRVTLLCGLLTFIVLRSSLGAGKFGTPVQDYDEIRHHLRSFRLRQHQKLLITRELAVQATIRKDASRSTLSLPTLPSEELEGYNVNSSGGGVDRAGAGSLTAPSSAAPRTMLVTSSLLAQCESTVEAQFLHKLLENKMDYCRLHGIEVFIEEENNVVTEAAKLRLFHKLLVSHPEVEWIWWMDSTAMVTNMSYKLPYERYTGHNVVTHSLGNGASHGVRGSILVRNSEWTLAYLANAELPVGLSGDVLIDMETKMEIYCRQIGIGNTLPFITDFRSCNVCSKNIDLSCLGHIERAYILADGQLRHVASL